MFYRLLKIFLGPILKVLYRPWIKGAERIPGEGPAILASNHLAVIDSFFLPLMIEREVVFIGKSDYFTGKGLKGNLVRRFMTAVGTIPVDRSGGKKSFAALRKGLSRLNEGELFGIYPEGTRSPDGRLYRGKTGVARLALQSGAPVIPVAMINTNLAQPIGTVIPKLNHRIGIVVGEPLDFTRYQGLEDDRYVLRAITDEIMYSLMSLSGQEYVDLYAADVKKSVEKAKQKNRVKSEADAKPGVEEKTRQRSLPEAPGGRQAPEVSVPEPPEEPAKKAEGDKGNQSSEAADCSKAAEGREPDPSLRSESGTGAAAINEITDELAGQAKQKTGGITNKTKGAVPKAEAAHRNPKKSK